MFLTGGAFLLAAGLSVAQQDTVKPVASVKELMDVFTVPLSDAIFDASVEPPETETEWSKVKTSALALAESGNLLMIGGRARDPRNWMSISRAQVDAAEAAMRAAEVRDLDALSRAGDALSETCYACHERYLAPGTP
jgi:hypothetical protein